MEKSYKKYEKIYDNDQAAVLFAKQIQCQTKFLISRIGGNELDLYLQSKLMTPKQLINHPIVIAMKKYTGYYDKNNEIDNLIKYCDLFKKCYDCSNIIMINTAKLSSFLQFFKVGHPYYVKNNKFEEQSQSNIDDLLENKIIFNYHAVVESFIYFDQWFPLLDNKKILIISTFDDEIKQQLSIKDQLFAKQHLRKYPNFAKVSYVHTHLTLSDLEKPHNNWFETYQSYCKQIACADFDIALLFCGCYSYPIAQYIYSEINKSAIIVGGVAQLFFGITGNRYETPFFKQFMNNKWIHRKLNFSPDGTNNEGLKAYFIFNKTINK